MRFTVRPGEHPNRLFPNFHLQEAQVVSSSPSFDEITLLPERNLKSIHRVDYIFYRLFWRYGHTSFVEYFNEFDMKFIEGRIDQTAIDYRSPEGY